MLGKLAKWLRLLGYDSEYSNQIGDMVLMRRAKETGRILLTRDREIIWKMKKHLCENFLFIQNDAPILQLREVIHHYNLNTRDFLFTRCILCNTALEKISRKNEVEGKVPEYIFHSRRLFSFCPHCKKIYWEGSHKKRILERLTRITRGNTG